MKKGQTLLMLLVYVIIGITVLSATAVLILVNIQNTQKIQGGMIALQVAESGMENALLRLLRDPYYTGTGYHGEPPVPMPDGTATITVTGNNPYTITSIGTAFNSSFSRKIEVNVSYNLKMTINSWKEVN